MDFFLLIANVILISGIIYFAFFKDKKSEKPQKSEVTNSILELKNIGELSVFRIYSKEIVTSTSKAFDDDFLGKILNFPMTEKKIAVIFEFEIDFIYDLLSPEFKISPLGDDKYDILMPPCKYKVYMENIKFYDEQEAKFMPFFLPEFISSKLTGKFSAEEKNLLIKKAQDEAKNLSLKIINDLGGKIHKSATDTLEAIARSFGAKELAFKFQDKTIDRIDVASGKIDILEGSPKQVEQN